MINIYKIFTFILLLTFSLPCIAEEKIAIVTATCTDSDSDALNKNALLLQEILKQKTQYNLINTDTIKKDFGKKGIYIEEKNDLDSYLSQLSLISDNFWKTPKKEAVKLEKLINEFRTQTPYSNRKWEILSKARVTMGFFKVSFNEMKQTEDNYINLLMTVPNYPFAGYDASHKEKLSMEAAQKRFKDGKKVVFKIDSVPSGSKVFIEGREMGQTPFSKQLPCGDFHIQTGKDNKYSLPRIVNVCNKKTPLFIDLDFEGQISRSLNIGFDISNPVNSTQEGIITLASKFGRLLDLDKIVILSFVKHENNDFLASYIVDVNSKKLSFKGYIASPVKQLADSNLSALADFITTGKSFAPVEEKSINIIMSKCVTSPIDEATKKAILSGINKDILKTEKKTSEIPVSAWKKDENERLKDKKSEQWYKNKWVWGVITGTAIIIATSTYLYFALDNDDDSLDIIVKTPNPSDNKY